MISQGVRAVIAESFQKMHKNHLVGMGIAPLQFLNGQSAESLGLCGKERFSVSIPEQITPRQELTVLVGFRSLPHILFDFLLAHLLARPWGGVFFLSQLCGHCDHF